MKDVSTTMEIMTEQAGKHNWQYLNKTKALIDWVFNVFIICLARV